MKSVLDSELYNLKIETPTYNKCKKTIEEAKENAEKRTLSPLRKTRKALLSTILNRSRTKSMSEGKSLRQKLTSVQKRLLNELTALRNAVLSYPKLFGSFQKTKLAHFLRLFWLKFVTLLTSIKFSTILDPHSTCKLNKLFSIDLFRWQSNGFTEQPWSSEDKYFTDPKASVFSLVNLHERPFEVMCSKEGEFAIYGGLDMGPLLVEVIYLS